MVNIFLFLDWGGDARGPQLHDAAAVRGPHGNGMGGPAAARGPHCGERHPEGRGISFHTNVFLPLLRT